VSAEDVALELLERHLIHLHPGYLFDFAQDDHLVISLLLPEEVFQEGVTRLTHGLRDLLTH
jgi:aspartate/methionine/tyrosine aminotransferase